MAVVIVWRAIEFAERVNAAAELVEAGVPVVDAARVLAGRFGVFARVRRAGIWAGRGRRAG